MSKLLGITCLLIFLFTVVNTTAIFGQTRNEIEKHTKNRTERLEWWNEAPYGMFIHWGVYAQLASEWQEKRVEDDGEWIMYHGKIQVKEYEQVAATFNPVKFNTEEWVKTTIDAGMKYIVISAKHCDGFAMYDSDASNYNMLDFTPFNRDPLMELRTACDKYGLKLGFYYSHVWDWHEPNAKVLDNTWDFPETDKKDSTVYFEKKAFRKLGNWIVNIPLYNVV